MKSKIIFTATIAYTTLTFASYTSDVKKSDGVHNYTGTTGEIADRPETKPAPGRAAPVHSAPVHAAPSAPARVQAQPHVVQPPSPRQSVQPVARPHVSQPPIVRSQPQAIQSQQGNQIRSSLRGYSRTPSMGRTDQYYRQRTSPFVMTPRAPSSTVNIPQQRNIGRPTTNIPLDSSGRPSSIQTRDRVREFLKQSRPSTVARPTTVPGRDKNFIDKNRQNNLPAVGRARDRIDRNHPHHRDWFNDNFFSRHNYHPDYYHRGEDWWRGADWIVINNFLSPGWDYPIYYDDTGYQIPLQGYQEPYQAPAPNYAGAPVSEWLPFGIFAAGKSIDQASYSTMFIQLAVNKAGEIAGTYYNSSTDQLHPLEGAIINETQQVAWTVADNPSSPLMTTGVYDLTQDVVPVQVHFPEGDEQSWVLVRLQE